MTKVVSHFFCPYIRRFYKEGDNPGFYEVSFEVLAPYLKANYEKAVEECNRLAYYIRYTEESVTQEELILQY